MVMKTLEQISRRTVRATVDIIDVLS